MITEKDQAIADIKDEIDGDYDEMSNIVAVATERFINSDYFESEVDSLHGGDSTTFYSAFKYCVNESIAARAAVIYEQRRPSTVPDPDAEMRDAGHKNEDFS